MLNRFPGVKKSLSDFGVTVGSTPDNNDDDFELFGSDEEVCDHNFD